MALDNIITKDKLALYKRFGGDIDAWARSQNSKGLMNDDDWLLIESLVQDILLIHNGNASIEYTEKVNANLKVSCDSDETIRQLKKIALSMTNE
jgi:hypothetical protein